MAIPSFTSVSVPKLAGFTGIGAPPIYSLGSVNGQTVTGTNTPGISTSLCFGGAINTITVQITSVSGTPTYSVQVQASLDGIHWYNIGSPISSDGLTTITNACVPYVALNLVSCSGGTIIGVVCGH